MYFHQRGRVRTTRILYIYPTGHAHRHMLLGHLADMPSRRHQWSTRRMNDTDFLG